MRLILFALIGICHSFTPLPSPSHSTTALSETFQGTVVVCSGPTCTRSGARKTKKLLEDLAPEGVSVESVKCVSECAMCAMGPNVEIRANGAEGPFYPMENRVKTEEDVKKIFGLE